MASKNIKGITIKIGADVTKLDDSLKSADKSIKSVRDELTEVEKALKLDPSNVTLVQQRHQLLAEQAQKTSEKLGMLKNVQGEIENQFKNGKISGEQYRAFQREVINTENALRGLENQTGSQNKASEKLKTAMESLKERLQKVTNIAEKFANTAKKLAEVSLKALTTSLKAVAAEVEVGMKAFQAYVTGLTTATTAIGAFAIKSGASFEASMSKVQSLSGASGDELKALEDKAREMGASTSKSASEAADALGYMALAGWDNTQMLQGLEPILRASEAGEMDLARCSDLVTDSMSAMGITTDNLNHYLDVVTKTQSSANTSMQGMLEAYIGCGGTLKNLEVPLEESATLIGILANRGIKGSEAGTSLNSVLVNLMGSGGQAAEALESLGVSMYNVDGTRKSVTQTLTELNDALSRCSDAEKDVFTAHIGGKTQMDTLQALLAGLNEEYGDLYGGLQNVDGVLIDTAKTMQDNFNGAVTAAKSAIEGLGISIFKTFSPDLTGIIKIATGFISRLSEGIDNGNLFAVLHSITGEISNILTDSMSDIAEKISQGTGIFNTVIVSIVNVITKTLPGVTSKILPKLLKGLTDLVNGLTGLLPALVPEVAEAAITLFTGILDGMSQIAGRLKGVIPVIIKNTVPAIVEALPVLFETGVSILGSLIEGIVASVPTLLDSARDLLMSFIQMILNNLPEMIDTGIKLIFELVDAVLEFIPELLPEILDAAVRLVQMLTGSIRENIGLIINSAVYIVNTLLETIVNNLDVIIDSAIEIVTALCDAIVDNLDLIIEAAIEIVIAVFNAVIENLDKIIDAAIEILVTLGSALLDSATKCIDYIPQLIDKIKDAFLNHNWKETGENIMNSIFDGITGIAESAGSLLSTAGEHIIDAFGFHPDGTFSLPFFANGGILTSGSAIVGEAGPELLSVANGRAVVTPLSSGDTNTSNVNSSTTNIYNTVYVEKVSSDYDVTRISEQLAVEQRNSLAAVGG